jgi:hypothetical protein
MESGSVSIALIPAAVTTVIKNLLENGLINHGMTSHLGSDILVSAQPFDRVETGENEHARINLFLYQLNPKGISTFSRHQDLKPGEPSYRFVSAIEMFYIISGYGAQDLHAEMLIGCALQSLHEAGSLTGEQVRSILGSQSKPKAGRVVPPAQAAVTASGAAEMIKCLKIVPFMLDPDNLLSIWSSQQSAYRPSLTYQATVFLAEPSTEQ